LKKEEGEDDEVMMNLKEIEGWRGIWIGSDDWIWRENFGGEQSFD